MGHRITLPEMNSLVAEITTHAVTLDLIPPGSKIWWVPGGQGVAPSTPVLTDATWGGKTPLHVSFLPDFKSADTTTDAHRALAATCKALAVLAGRTTP